MYTDLDGDGKNDPIPYISNNAVVIGAGTSPCPPPSPEPPPTPPPPVGGVAYPVNKLVILAPWIALALAVVATGVILIRRRAFTSK